MRGRLGHPYKKGIYYEKKCMAALAEAGYYVMRSAGSHGPVDVIALGHGECLAIQVTSTKKGVRKKIEALKELDLPPFCRKQVWLWRTGQGWEVIDV